jgi:putative glutamine amidotransferase
MLIFITQKSIRDEYGFELDALEATYITYFTGENIFSSPPVLLPVPNNIVQARRLNAALRPDLLVLTGSNNIDPKSFGSDVKLDDLAPRRDEVERYLLDFSLAENIPVIGICRGFHFINVYLGGNLTLNLSGHPPAVGHDCEYEGKKYRVNSFHNHGITADDLAEGLVPVARTTDGRLIEAYAATGRGKTSGKRILAVQWHPERPGADTHLFQRLVEKYIGFEKGS